MTLLLAAVGATLMALLELTVGPYLRIGTAQPHLVLVVGIVVTVAVGLEAGLIWAFVGGLVLDVLAQRPLGSTSFALLLCMGATSVLARLFIRLRPVVPILPPALDLFLGDPLRRVQCLRRSVADPSNRASEARSTTPFSLPVGPSDLHHDRRTDAERMDW
jgi:rod shape-determining protein MreD